VSESTFTRRDFLRVAAGAAAVAATGTACGSGSDNPKPNGAAAKGGASKGRRTLRIAQWSHFVPAYDTWFDNEYTTRWGEDHDVGVIVDHIPLLQLPARADAEVAAGRGHDIFGFSLPPPAFEDHVIDHREIVEEVEAKLGPMTPLVDRSVRNPKTGKYFAFPDYWVANAVHYRADLWEQADPGGRPDTWDDILRAAPALKAIGHPVGLSLADGDGDANVSLMGLMHAFGSAIQDQEASVVINSPATVEAVKLQSAIFRAGMTDEVFSWDGTSNNRHLASGKGSLILNAISALRAIEAQDPVLARKVELLPTPAGPEGRAGTGLYVMGVSVIWRFSPNQELAKRFLADLVLNYREPFRRSGLYNLPAFPGAVPDLKELTAAEVTGKYAFLADATAWSTNLGHPGHVNAAIDEVVNQYLVPKMFAAAARGEMTPEEAVRAAEARITTIFEKWRERGKV
jgi:multiple sugar transport system substrate-binding protein